MSRVSLVMAVFNQLPLTRACLESLRPTTVTFDLVVVDNGSTDGPAEFLRAFPYPFPFRAHQNQGNLGLIRALNQGWRLAGGEFVCFLHNDTEMRDPRWLARVRREALARFAAKWRHRLPSDVRRPAQRIRDWLSSRPKGRVPAEEARSARACGISGGGGAGAPPGRGPR